MVSQIHMIWLSLNQIDCIDSSVKGVKLSVIILKFVYVTEIKVCQKTFVPASKIALILTFDPPFENNCPKYVNEIHCKFHCSNVL